jgi:3',5'-cyclic-AMP phosphodiesterase
MHPHSDAAGVSLITGTGMIAKRGRVGRSGLLVEDASAVATPGRFAATGAGATHRFEPQALDRATWRFELCRQFPSQGLPRWIYACAVLVAHLSDTHLLADPNAQLWGHSTTRSMAAVIEALPPRVDVMVVTGDVAEDGTNEAYKRALSLTAGHAQRRYFLAGNHDDPKVMRDVFGPAEPLQMVRIAQRWTMALVNSQWVGHEAGQVTDETLMRLRDELARVRTHVVVCLHHPPTSPCDNAACGLTDNGQFCEVIENGPVRLVLSGHVHQHFDTTRRRRQIHRRAVDVPSAPPWRKSALHGLTGVARRPTRRTRRRRRHLSSRPRQLTPSRCRFARRRPLQAIKPPEHTA